MILYDKKEAGVRLSQLISDSGLNSRQFALSIDGDPSYLAKMEKGDKGISKTYLEKLEQKYRINREWLLYGTGEMYLNGQKVPYGTLANVSGANFRDQLRDKKNTTHPFLVPLVPVKAQAGYAASYDNIEFINELEMRPMLPGFDHRGAVWRYFEIKGDSMETTLFEKEVILVSMVPHEDWRDIKPNQVYVVLWREEVLVKIVIPINTETWVLASSNKRVKQIKVTVADIKEVWKFQGKTTRRLEIPKIEIKV